MEKYLITEWNNCILTASYNGARVTAMDFTPKKDAQILGNIYVARVERVVKNLNAAFIRYGENERAYCSLDQPIYPIYQTIRRDGVLREGDIILAQITQEAMKTKEPCVSVNLSLSGRYAVLEVGAPALLNFSRKVKSREVRRAWEEYFQKKSAEDGWNPGEGDPAGAQTAPVGFILRTNAQNVPEEIVYREMRELYRQYRELAQNGIYRSLYSMLYQAPPFYLCRVRDAFAGELDEVVTDSEALYEQLRKSLSLYPDITEKIRLYRDQLLPLSKLYPLDKAMREALSKRVWLRSGGYLVIEQTEACVVIDVNTGKYDVKKEREAAFLKINLEAADEIAVQLRLRNLSGMILVDFINMKDPAHDDQLMKYLRDAVSKDKVSVTVVDMTRLKLVELTRKKERKPLSQQYAEAVGSALDSPEKSGK